MRKKLILIFISMIFILSISSSGVYGKIFNSPPNPPIIDGPTSGQIGTTYTYYFTLTDPDPDDIMFNLEVDFGNNIIAEDCGCDKSWKNGTIVEVPYQWSRSNDYQIRARIQGEYGDWSEWSEPYIVTMPRSHLYNDIQNFINILISKIQYISQIFI
jgi:hypothetical protein